MFYSFFFFKTEQQIKEKKEKDHQDFLKRSAKFKVIIHKKLKKIYAKYTRRQMLLQRGYMFSKTYARRNLILSIIYFYYLMKRDDFPFDEEIIIMFCIIVGIIQVFKRVRDQINYRLQVFSLNLEIDFFNEFMLMFRSMRIVILLYRATFFNQLINYYNYILYYTTIRQVCANYNLNYNIFIYFYIINDLYLILFDEYFTENANFQYYFDNLQYHTYEGMKKYYLDCENIF